jgi:hypothetical protein
MLNITHNTLRANAGAQKQGSLLARLSAYHVMNQCKELQSALGGTVLCSCGIYAPAHTHYVVLYTMYSQTSALNFQNVKM